MDPHLRDLTDDDAELIEFAGGPCAELVGASSRDSADSANSADGVARSSTFTQE
tara:strand:+ start:2718 stop:2879 length:162 start_codon:yes stop_codon:yes gene_type:complete